MSRLMAAVVLASAIMGCTKPATSSSSGGGPVSGPEPGVDPAEEKAVLLVEKRGGTVDRMVSVVLSGQEITDADLKELAGLKQLSRLYLQATKITDAGANDIAGFSKLTHLDIHNTGITDAGLKSLLGLQRLKQLSLGGPKITNAGFAELAKLKNLTFLNIGKGSMITHEGTEPVRQALPKLHFHRGLDELGPEDIKPGKPIAAEKSASGDPAEDRALAFVAKHGAKVSREVIVELSEKEFTDADLKELTGLPSITILNLGLTKVSDAGLKELAAFKNLHRLTVGRNITDAGVKDLANLKSLSSLTLHATMVTDAGATELRKSLPKCHVSVIPATIQ